MTKIDHCNLEAYAVESDQNEKHLEEFTSDEKYMIKLMAGIIVKNIINNKECPLISSDNNRSRTKNL
jgi:hypothetical protein